MGWCSRFVFGKWCLTLDVGNGKRNIHGRGYVVIYGPGRSSLRVTGKFSI